MAREQRHPSMALRRLCCMALLLGILHLLPSVSSQPPSEPLPTQCLAGPCAYAGECRDRFGACGVTVAQCNAESTWVPACGGGAGLEKPAPTPLQQPPPPPTNRPVMPPPAVIAQPQPQPIPAPVSPQIELSINEEPSSRPTTNWELWLSNKNKPTGSGGGGNEGVAGLTTGKEGQGDYVPTNATEGFDPDSWGYRGDEGGGGVLDDIGFLGGNSATGESINGVIFLLSGVLAWAALS